MGRGLGCGAPHTSPMLATTASPNAHALLQSAIARTTFKAAFAFVFAFAVAAALPAAVSAATLYEQNISADLSTIGTGNAGINSSWGQTGVTLGAVTIKKWMIAITPGIDFPGITGSGTWSANDCPVQDFQINFWNSGNNTFPTTNNNCTMDTSTGILEVWNNTGVSIASGTYEFRSGYGLIPQPELAGSASDVITGAAFGNSGPPATPPGALTGLSDLFLIICDDTTCAPPSPVPLTGKSHTIEITSPVLFATTTSPTTFNFSYEIGSNEWEFGTASTTVPIGYRIVAHDTHSNTRVAYGTLTATNTGYHTMTTSAVPFTPGTWYVEITLGNWYENIPENAIDSIFPYTKASTYFGIDFNDNIQTVVAYEAPQQSSYDPASCSVNFLGTFDLIQCLGYLIVPTTGSTSPITQIKNLTLANSFPFAYAYQVGTIRESLYNATSTGSTTITVDIPWAGSTTPITFLSKSMLEAIPYADFVKQILGWLLWLFLAELLYRQILKSHDDNTHVS